MEELTYNQIKSLARLYASEDFTEFSLQLDPEFELTQFHESYYSVLHLFAIGVIKNLIITVPSQHGKSEGSTRKLPAFVLGRDPNKRIAIVSYAGTFAKKFNKSIQRNIDNHIYSEIFPETKLNSSSNSKDSSWLRNSQEFEIVGKKGSLKAIGRDGQLTGDPVDMAILDDLYKDIMEGNSPVIRSSVIDFYDSVLEKRLHNKSQKLIVFTRWHNEDLIGYIEKNEEVIEVGSISEIYEAVKKDPDIWIKLNYEAIKESDPTELDPREKGQALWEERHGIKKFLKERKRNPILFECMNQGNPNSKEGALYGEFKTYETLPTTRKKSNYTDTADTGDDYLGSICYEVGLDNLCYVTDIVYTQEDMSKTEIYVPLMLNRNDTRESNIESNNGGRGFARVVDKKAPMCRVKWFHQSENKEARILTNATSVNDKIIFPADWAIRWPLFYEHVTKYKRVFKANKHDDCADVLTGIIEMEYTKKKSKARRTN